MHYFNYLFFSSLNLEAETVSEENKFAVGFHISETGILRKYVLCILIPQNG